MITLAEIVAAVTAKKTVDPLMMAEVVGGLAALLRQYEQLTDQLAKLLTDAHAAAEKTRTDIEHLLNLRSIFQGFAKPGGTKPEESKT